MNGLFDPPRTISTRVFARLPDHLRKGGPNPRWHSHHTGIGWNHSFLEGPSFDRNGNLFCVDLAWGRVFRIDQKGSFDVVTEYDGEPNGLKIHADGRIFITDFRRGLLTLDSESGRIDTVVDRYHMEPFKGLNDLFFSRNGDLYFTDQGFSGLTDPQGRLFRLSRNGTLECLLKGIPSPNGVLLDNNEEAVLVAVTRSNSVWRLPFMKDGTVDRVGNYIQLSGGRGPDGLAMDQDSNLAIAHAGLGTVWICDHLGQLAARVVSCEGKLTTNLAFGGEGGRQLFITESQSGTILQADMPSAGAPMYSVADVAAG